MADRPKLDRIKSGVFSRGFALARMSVNAGAKAASHAVGGIFAEEGSKEERLKQFLLSQVSNFTQEIGQLKGSLMKVGQLMSTYGEHFLPPEANAVLKSLQQESPSVAWPEMEKVLRRQLTPEQLGQLTIDPEPRASASLGQVHQARRKSDGQLLAMKIQYPGVDKAIEGDLKALRSMMSMAKLIPAGPNVDELFKEIKSMLMQEVDYDREIKLTNEFRERIAGDSRYVIPETFPEFSSNRVLTTSWEEGVPVDSPEVAALSQERRNAIALAAMEFYFRELFEWRAVQTDPHFGNYRVRLGRDGAPDQLVLFDFGATREVPKKFLDPYKTMARGAILRDVALVREGAVKLGFLTEDDSVEFVQKFAELVFLITEPFDASLDGGLYDWGASDLPKRVMRAVAGIAFTIKLRTPPKEIIFLDRKMGGIFIFLSVLKARIPARELILKYVSL